MPLDLSKLEEFFETKFEPKEKPTQDSMRDLFHFDGDAHWYFGVHENRQVIWITAKNRPEFMSFPIVEVGVHYSDFNVRLSPYWDGGKILIIHPQGCKTGANLLVLTKNAKGKISLSTTIGDGPEDSNDTLVSDFFGKSD